MSRESCDPDVYEHGISLGFADLTKEEAEEWCEKKSKETGDKYDWHYAEGRVHIKYLPAQAK